MSSRYKQLSNKDVKTFSIKERIHKVKVADCGRPGEADISFIDSLPAQLKASDWKEFVGLVADCFRSRRPVILMLGGHVIKVGCAPYLIDWVRRGFISGVAYNGSTAIHDCELAMWGETSEDVAQGLENGTFGMVEETPELFGAALKLAHEQEKGFGEAIGETLVARKAPNREISLTAACWENSVPLSIHVAIGTDTIHQHPQINGSWLGGATMRDFDIFAACVADLKEGSVIINFGSAVILPEVFLKALTLARNLGYPSSGLVAADFSMIQQYRAMVNVVGRPTLAGGGRGFSFIGHHELMIPLLHACVEEELKRK